MNPFAHGLRWNRLIMVSALILSCSSIVLAQTPARSFVETMEHVELIPHGDHDSEMLAKVDDAIGFIKRMELRQAHFAVNEALQLDPRNAYLHFLNGFVYHLQALKGDTQKAEIALEGYQQSLRIDPSNWIALEFMGLAYMDLKRFDFAKQAFADALLLTPESAPSISGLMVASYLTGDAKTACGMADQYLKVSAMPTAEFLRSSIPVYGSCGNFARAEWVGAALIEQYGNSPELERIDRRLTQWKDLYDDPSPLLAQAFSIPDLSPSMVEEPFDQDGQDAELDNNGTAVQQAPVMASAADPRMLLVDVVLLSTQELMSTSRGVNLLNALTMQLGSVGGNLPAYSRIISSNDGSSSSTSITRAVTIPALSYSLNIANANSSVNEVLARPTLAAIEGLPSEFFSGTNLSAGVVSTSQEGGTTIVPLEKRFGIKLSVTPNFLSQGQVQLKVEAQRTSLNTSTDNPRVAYQIEIGETSANANVVMNLGDTLVLSGLSEKSSSSARDGVPGLQRIPGIQYLFSNKRTNELQRSVLILVTPRAPVQLSDTASSANESMNGRMKQLQERFGFADRTPENIEAIMTQLQTGEYFREFRQGDVSLERWDRSHATADRLKEALRFLYY